MREVGHYLAMGEDSLRAACLQGRCPFGFGWTSAGSDRSGFNVPTIAFLSWMTKGTVAME